MLLLTKVALLLSFRYTDPPLVAELLANHAPCRAMDTFASAHMSPPSWPAWFALHVGLKYAAGTSNEGQMKWWWLSVGYLHTVPHWGGHVKQLEYMAHSIFHSDLQGRKLRHSCYNLLNQMLKMTGDMKLADAMFRLQCMEF